MPLQTTSLLKTISWRFPNLSCGTSPSPCRQRTGRRFPLRRKRRSGTWASCASPSPALLTNVRVIPPQPFAPRDTAWDRRGAVVRVADRRVRFPAVEALAKARVAPCAAGVRQSRDCLRPRSPRRPRAFAAASPSVSGNRPHFHGDARAVARRPLVPAPATRRIPPAAPGSRLRAGCGAMLSSRAAPPAHPRRHPRRAAPRSPSRSSRPPRSAAPRFHRGLSATGRTDARPPTYRSRAVTHTILISVGLHLPCCTASMRIQCGINSRRWFLPPRIETITRNILILAVPISLPGWSLVPP